MHRIFQAIRPKALPHDKILRPFPWGIRLSEIPYKDVGLAAVDLIAGQLSVIFLDTVASAQHVQSGSLKPLAITSGERNKDLPGCAKSVRGISRLRDSGISTAIREAGLPERCKSPWSSEGGRTAPRRSGVLGKRYRCDDQAQDVG
jgi:hypothetical protein